MTTVPIIIYVGGLFLAASLGSLGTLIILRIGALQIEVGKLKKILED